MLCEFSYAALAKRANVESASSPMGSNFSYESKYASRSDGMINLLTGKPYCNIKLVTLQSKSGVKYDINLVYNGSIQGEIFKDNSEASTGLVGLGWRYSPETIFRDTKGTVDLSDDNFYYVEQNGTVSELIDLGSGKYQLKNHPYWKVSFESDYFIIIYPDGTRLEFGSTRNSKRFVYYDNNYSDGGDQNRLDYQYDLAAVKSPNGSGGINFDYNVSTNYSSIEQIYEHSEDRRPICIRIDGLMNCGPKGFLYNGQRVDEYGCLGSRDMDCFIRNKDYYWEKTNLKSSAPDLKNSIDLLHYEIEHNYAGYHNWCLNEKWDINLFKKTVKHVGTKTHGLYVSSSVPSSISSDNNTKITFDYDKKSINEYKVRIEGHNDLIIKSIAISRNDFSQEQINFYYSGEENQIPHVNAGTDNPKRLLTRIQSSIKTGISRVFEYGVDANNLGCLTKVIDPISGKSTKYEYKFNDIRNESGTMLSVGVVNKITQYSGVDGSPNIETSYNYTNNSSEQFYDEGSNIPYWGEITALSSNGKIKTKFDLNRSNHKFGTRIGLEMYNTNSKIIYLENYTYSTQSFGPPESLWYSPVLICTESNKNGVAKLNGTPVCAIDPVNGMAKISWVKNSDGKFLLTKRTYAYEENPEMGVNGTNQLSQVASTKIIQLDTYDPNSNACDLSVGKVVKATYTIWSNDNNNGYWRPAATYAWNSQMNNNGIPLNTFVEFSKSTPTANNWQLTSKIDMYDDYGNILQMTNANNMPISVIYGSKHFAPVATIANSKYNECFFTSFEDNTNPFTLAPYFKIPRSNVVSKTGEYSGIIENKGTAVLSAESPWKTISQSGLPISKEFTFSGWIYSTGPSAKISFYTSISDTKPENVRFKVISIAPGDVNKWVFVKGTLLASVGVKHIMIRLDNDGAVSGNEKVYFDDIKYYPSDAFMTTTYYDSKWPMKVFAVDNDENPSSLLTLDSHGRPEYEYKVDKSKSQNDISGLTLLSKREYHLSGDDLKLLTPNGGEKLYSGQKLLITWSGPYTVGKNGVDLFYYNGVSWVPIIGATQLINTNSYIWDIPTSVQGNCKIKVVENGNTANYDETDSFIISDYLRITSPLLNEVWWAGSRTWAPKYEIKWNSSGTASNVSIEYYDGAKWKIITSSTPNTGTYEWNPVGFKQSVGLTRLKISEVGAENSIRISEPFWLYTRNQTFKRLLLLGKH
jgi:hypothetical protein